MRLDKTKKMWHNMMQQKQWGMEDMTEELARVLTEALGGFPPLAVVFIISMIPILELRGGLIAAAMLGLNVWVAAIVCVIGNLVPIPFILLFVEKLLGWLKNSRVKFFNKIANWLEARATGEKANSIRKYEFWGLALFVGIPLPGTGAWTGSLIAALIHMDRKKAVGAILLGVAMAAVIMCIVSYGGLAAIEGLFS